ncbi:hypothetical protein ABZ690_21025 [Streptomyces sp. NPDC006967]|uniref:hypothetical protein n=1 Tax=Streptomyces sp. NPDC006967 TaxID=3156906 RepID=UPI003405C976
MIRVSLTAADGRAVEIQHEDPAYGPTNTASLAENLISHLAEQPAPRPAGFSVDSSHERAEDPQ